MPQVHPQALVSESAQLAEDVEIGPFAIIEDHVTIGSGCQIASQAKICRGVVMGENNMIEHGAVIGGLPQDLSFDPSTKSGVLIGNGNTFREYVTINRATHPGGNTIVGDRNFIMAVTHLAHDVEIGNDNIIANNVMIAGHCHLGSQIFLGGGAGFHQFIHIGDFAMAQGNSSISKDIPPYCTAHRNNILSGLNVIALKRGGFSPSERKEIKLAYSMVLNSKFNRAEALAQADQLTWSPTAAIIIEAVRSPSNKGILTR